MDRRIEKTKKAIREAYFELLMKNTNSRITVTEIAQKANINRKTFYLHFDSVDDIIKDFAQNKIDEIVLQLREKSTGNQPIDVRILFEVLNHTLEKNMDLFQIIALNQKYDYFFDRLRELFVEILSSDYQDYFHYPDVAFRIYADYFVSGILSVYMLWIRERLPVSLETLTDMLNEAAYGGLQSLLPKQQA